MDRLIYTAMTGASHLLQQQAAVVAEFSQCQHSRLSRRLQHFSCGAADWRRFANTHLCGGLHFRQRFFAGPYKKPAVLSMWQCRVRVG